MIKWPLVSLACRKIDKYISVMHKNEELDIFNKFPSLNRKDMLKISEPVFRKTACRTIRHSFLLLSYNQ